MWNKRISRKTAASINFDFAVWILDDSKENIEEITEELIDMFVNEYGTIEIYND